MKDCSLSIAAGEAKTFAIAGVRFTLSCDLDPGRSFRLPKAFEPFRSEDGGGDVRIRVRSVPRLVPERGRLLFDSGIHWRCLRAKEATIYELFHPPTAALYCRARVAPDFCQAEILFADLAIRDLAPSIHPVPPDCDLIYPLDQLLFVPPLAERRAVLFHACGAVLKERAYVFTGHSGDGKTTLARLLRSEAVPLLSDERVAVHATERGFAASGTPWPGEGDVVSTESRPLGGLFVLRKSQGHSVGRSSASVLAPEILSRAIVPYYLPSIASRILETLSAALAEVPARELHFERKAGLRVLLESAA